MYSVEELGAFSVIDDEFAAALKHMPAIDPPNDVTGMRQMLAGLAAESKRQLLQDAHDYEEEDHSIEVRDGSYIKLRVHTRKSSQSGGSPVLVIYHGGAFAYGNLDTETITAKLWVDLGGIAVSVDYRLAPEHQFPIPQHDCYDALGWVATHIGDFGGDLGQGFLVAGNSAGANAAAVLSHLWVQEKKSPPLTGVFLSNPSILQLNRSKEHVPESYRPLFLSWEANKESPFLSQAGIVAVEGILREDPTSPLRFPLLFKDHSGLPPHHLQIGGLDPLRDEALIYNAVLQENGAKTKVDVYSGLPHGFQYFFTETSFGKKFWNDAVEGLKWLLDG